MNRPLWKVVLAAGLCVSVAYFALHGVAAKDLTYSAVGVASTICVWLGVRLHRPVERMGWYLLGAANACFVLGDGVLNVYDIVLHRSAPFPSVADALYLLGYPFLFAGVFRISRPRGARDSREARADAAIVCIGALAFSWQFLMRSYAHDSTVDGFGKLVTMAYPVMDLGVVFIVVSALLCGVARRPTDKLIIAAITATLVGDFVYDVLVLRGTYTVGNPVDAAFLINYVLIATAALHPSMAQALVATTSGRASGRRWMPLVATAGFVSPMILLIGSVARAAVDVPVLAGTSIALFALIVVRFSWLFSRTRQQTVLLAERGQSLQDALDTQLVLQDDLRHQAFHDSLTGLPNRALLQDRVEHALAALPRSGGIVALCFCDLDGFKAVNDSLGHQAGDELLVVAAKRLASIVRGGDTVARLGGDEFAVLFDNITTPDIATALAERMVAVLRQPTAVAGQQTSLTVSVGIAFAFAFADSGTTTEQLLSEADTAMYEAKALGKDRFTVFQSQMRSQLIDRLAMTNAFWGSLERDEFFLEYQPQISLVDGTLEGFEALVRWQHPTLGHLGPYRFIPLAEDTGFVVELGRWILEAACREAATWASRDGMPLTLSVNLSARQLDDPGLTSDVATALTSSGLDPTQLILEVTESMLMVDPVHTAQVLADLKATGIRIAIDDFGTGYSSLSYLRLFPVDMLKIDKSFVDPLTDPNSEGAAFVKTILRLARDLHLTTIAEGVEDPTQQKVLTQLQCDSAQGYLIARPLSTEKARAFINQTQDAAPLARQRPA